MKSNLSVRIKNIAALKKKRVSLLALLLGASMFLQAVGDEILYPQRL